MPMLRKWSTLGNSMWDSGLCRANCTTVHEGLSSSASSRMACGPLVGHALIQNMEALSLSFTGEQVSFIFMYT